MIIKTKYLVLGIVAAFVAIFLLGRYFGLSSGDNASTALIQHQNDIIKQYILDLDSLEKRIAVQDIIIATQNSIIEQNFVHKKEFDDIILVQKTKLAQIEEKIEQLQEREPAIIIQPVHSGFDGILLAEKFCEQNGLNKKREVNTSLLLSSYRLS